MNFFFAVRKCSIAQHNIPSQSFPKVCYTNPEKKNPRCNTFLCQKNTVTRNLRL